MADLTGSPASSTLLRWSTAIFTLANIAFVFDYLKLGDAPSLAEALADAGGSVLPGRFALLVAALLLGAFVLFYLVALWPRRRPRLVYDTLMLPLALTGVLCSVGIVAIRHAAPAIAATSIVGAFVLAAAMFARVAAVSPNPHSGWLRFPFALHFGAMSLALLFYAVPWLMASGLPAGKTPAPEDLASAALAIAAVLGAWVVIRTADVTYPATIAAGAGAIGLAQLASQPEIASDALLACIGMLVMAALAAVSQVRHARHDQRRQPARIPAVSARKEAGERLFLIEPTTSIMRF